MTVIRHEWRQGLKSLALWTAAIAFFIVVCVFMYPEMEGEMANVGDMFSSMGAFTAAFGLDSLDFGSLMGYYAIECGNILGLGGALFASLLGAGMLAKEEGEGTAELLLTHPVSRKSVVLQKLAATVLRITALNAAVLALSALSLRLVGGEVRWHEVLLLHLGYYLMQLELGCLCFGLSAFLRRGGAGLGTAVAAVMYFLNIIKNISESARHLRYVTPFAYCEAADILKNKALDLPLIALGAAVSAAAVAIALYRYSRKDIM